ncbi:hypothetical protein MMC13_002453 [Lambiella insularis]|nr:hypothetical protein [Lambiella insularis]
MAMPQIPPRPNRAHLHIPPAATAMEPPKVPPRPSYRRLDRSESPHRDSFARSPLNEAPFAMNYGNISAGSNGQNASNLNLALPARPPSVTLPSIGQEGNEYAEIAYDEPENAPDETASASPTQTRNVGNDLPLHAPKPSLSTTSAKARIATVTRTDSSQAAAAGFGKAATPLQPDDKDPHTRPLKGRESFSSTRSSASTERPGSAQVEDEHGIPEIGQRVPMYPNAGDVQAPSPSPYSQIHPSGIGYHNDGSKPRHHGRTRSGRETFQGPPGSYGLHGHGVASPDKFERAWYDKHPDALLREESGQYGPGIGGGRGEWAMSSEDLNKIVKETAARGSGFGTSPDIVGRPDEQIGYLASEEYTSRLSSPRPQSSTYHNKAHSHSQTHVESPLRKASFPVDILGKTDFEKSKESGLRSSEEQALESEAEDEDVIHIDQPEVRTSKLTGNGYDPPTEDLGPRGGNTESEGGWIEETGYGVPILASDEVAKTPGLEYLQPAVTPSQEHRGSTYHSGIDSDVPLSYQSGYRHGSRSGSASSSRPTSRPGSIHGSLPGLARFISHDDREEMHTPLEDVDEYEPLFPDDQAKPSQPHTPADRFKQRPDIQRRFPSQDIWEDTPNSLQLQATVSIPEPNMEQPKEEIQPASVVFETPETEAARKGEVVEEEKKDLLSKEERWSKSNFKPHLREERLRPGLKQRFPSSDIWEDSPDSAYLQTTVGGPQEDEIRSPPDEGLIAGAVVHTSGQPVEGKLVGNQGREGATTGAPAVDRPSIPPRPIHTKQVHEAPTNALHAPPSVPARPQKSRPLPTANVPSPLSKGFEDTTPVDVKQASPTEPRKAPMLPERAKPQLPARPARAIARDSSESVPLTKTAFATSTGSNGESPGPRDFTPPPPAPAPKPKPLLPARPAGSKIAALKAGFMSDLDKRLQLGPQAPVKVQEKPTEEEKEGEKAPLSDARKGRARGPVRRKPAASPAATEEDNPKTSKLEIAAPWTLWHVSPEGDGFLNVLDVTTSPVSNTSTELPREHASTDPIEAPTEIAEHSADQADDPVSVHQAPADPIKNETTATHSLDGMSEVDGGITDSLHNTTHTPTDVASEETPALNSSVTVNRVDQTDDKALAMDATPDDGAKSTAYEKSLAQREGDVLVRQTAEAEGEHTEEV